MSEHQLAVIKYLSTVNSATLAEIYENVNFGYYHNGNKHLGTVLSRMVKNKQIERVKKGVFKLYEAPKNEPIFFFGETI